MKNRILILLLVSAIAGTAIGRPEGAALDQHLEPLRPLLEKTWRGPFKGSKPEKPMFDVMRWERALNGKAVRVLHSVNDGIYGGETIMVWDEKKSAIVYHYYTTEGETTEGTLTVKDGKFTTHETVNGDSGGVTEVRATSEFEKDGAFHLKAEYLRAGAWAPGHEITYQQDAAAKVIFK